MKILIFIVCVLPAMGKIDVDITAAKDPKRSSVHASGMNIEGLTYSERESFGITDNKLKELIENYYGQYPLHAYLDKPGGEHPTDLYDKHGWTPVTRILYPMKSTVEGLNTEPTIVARQKFINRSKKYNATYNAAISQEVANEISTSWSNSKAIEVGQEINYGVSAGVFSLGGTTHYSFTGSWGSEETKSETVTVGTTSAVSVTLGPGELCIAELTATRGSMQVLVQYEAYLDGSVAIVYSSSYKGSTEHHLDINDILYYNNLPEEIRRNESVRVGFYANAIVEITDEDDKELAEGECYIVDNHGGGPYGDEYLVNGTTTTSRPPKKNRG